MLRALALALTTFTGMSGLVYEVTWERYLAILVGSHGEATAAVLGLFLGGLSVGYAAFGSITRRVIATAPPPERQARLLRLYGLVEAGIGVYALAFPLLFRAARFLSVRVPSGGGPLAETLAFGFDVALCALLIMPGAFLMGATIPVLTQALARDLDDATRVHARIYAFNTLGAVAGALGAGFVLLPRLGLAGSLFAMAIVNLAAGAAFLAMSRRSAAASDAGPGASLGAAVAAAHGAGGKPALRLYAGIGLLAGFAMMTLQTVVIRMAGLSFGASPYTFSMVVAVFVLGIALGSFAVGALSRVPRGALAVNLWLQAALLLALFFALEFLPWAVYLLRGLFRGVELAFPAYVASGLALVAVLVGPAAVFSGATLPLVFHELRDRFGDLGAAAGGLYSANTVGSLLGALLGGYALLFVLDLDGVYRVGLAALVIAAALASWSSFELPRLGTLLLALPLVVSVALLPDWRPQLLSGGLFRERKPPERAYSGPAYTVKRFMKQKMLFYDDDPVASVKVVEVDGPMGRSRSIVSNGKSDGNTLADYPTMSLAGLLPVLLGRGEAQRSFVIGYGTGVTAGELAALPAMRDVVVAEISPAVADAAPLFDDANLAASRSPKLRIVRSDAYRALQRAQGRFDVIVSEPSNPWVAGIDMLFTREFLEAARDRLSEGGIYVQWYHQYETSDAAVALVLRTFASVFDRVAVWYGTGADLLLLGIDGSQPLVGLDEIQRRMQRPEFRTALERSGIGTIGQLLAHELVPEGVIDAAELPGPLHELTHPRLGFEAAHAFFFGQPARLPYLGNGPAGARGRERALFSRLLGAMEDPERRDVLQRDYSLALCRDRQPECLATLARWERDRPASALRAAAVAHVLRHEPVFGPRVTRRDLKRARWLFEPRPPDAPARFESRELAEVNSLFVDAYHHAAPFDAVALRSLWNRCVDSRPGECARGRRDANALLSAASVERGVLGGSGGEAP